MKRNTVLLSVVLVCGIGAVTLLSRRSDTPKPSTHVETQTYSASQGATKSDSDASNAKAIAEAAASIARTAPIEPPDIEKVLNRKLAQSGQRIEAKVKMPDGVEVTPIVNEVGVMERLRIEPQQAVTVSLRYPEGQPGERVILTAYEGGYVNGNIRHAEVMTLDQNKAIEFEFKTGTNLGRYSVQIDKGSDEKIFRVWAGAERPLAVR